MFFSNLLLAWNFRDTIDANYTISFPVNNGYEVKKEKASEYGKTYKIHPRSSKRFIALISVLKTPEKNFTLAFARETAEEHGKQILPRSVEKKLVINEIKKSNEGDTIGFFYKLTDSHPAPDGYLYAIMGVLPKEKSIITFTYLFNYESESEFKSIIDTVSTIKIVFNNSQSKILPLLLKEGDLPDAKFGKDLIAKSIQVQYFYLMPNTYSAMLPPLAEKEIQSLESKSERGSVMFFRYDGDIESMKSFLSGLFYGPSGTPSNDHPEEFITQKDLLIIFAFEKGSNLGANVKKKMMEKIKAR